MNQYQKRVKIRRLSFPVDGCYNYFAEIQRSVDCGRTFYFCGEGKYFRTIAEALAHRKKLLSI